jgi:hypothetical protein
MRSAPLKVLALLTTLAVGTVGMAYCDEQALFQSSVQSNAYVLAQLAHQKGKKVHSGAYEVRLRPKEETSALYVIDFFDSDENGPSIGDRLQASGQFGSEKVTAEVRIKSTALGDLKASDFVVEPGP